MPYWHFAEGIESEEFDHASHVIDRGSAVSLLPVDHGEFVAADHSRRFELGQVEVEPALPDVLTEGLRACGVPGFLPKVGALFATNRQ